VKIRFAPSTTGYAHPGTLMSGLLCWLDARSRGAPFILRLENLDPERSNPAYERAMLHDLAWFGLDWDEVVDQRQNRNGMKRPWTVCPSWAFCILAPAAAPASRHVAVRRPTAVLLTTTPVGNGLCHRAVGGCAANLCAYICLMTGLNLPMKADG
jgi:hypothetical protein